MLTYRNAEGVHGQRKVGNPCPRRKKPLICCFSFSVVNVHHKIARAPSVRAQRSALDLDSK